ncbi:MAG: Ig-like domain-containing protein, partial [Bacteroidales bacterium]|nr:Ig-like domain-containing protein [Bacteroidales bacterium]
SGATNKAVAWRSSDTDVVTVDANGTVTALSTGTATVVAAAKNGGKSAVCTVTVNPSTHAYVDLGLPSGVKWATCNLGASSPEGYGDYYAWGETATYYSSLNPLTWKSGKSDGYYWTSYRWCEAVSAYDFNMTKYTTSDNKTVLETTDDAACVAWGGSWRMPSDADWSELLNSCTWTVSTLNGVSGRLVTGTNGNSIFLPAAGTLSGTNLLNSGSEGHYWSSSATTVPSTSYARFLMFGYNSFEGNDYNYCTSGGRANGRSIRPVL